VVCCVVWPHTHTQISFSPALSNDSFWGDTSGGVWKATYDQTKTDYGYYNFAFFARRSGTYQMFVNLLPGDASTPIQGSPFTVIVRSGPASGVTTTALGTGLSQAQAGVPATFQLNLMDAGGNPVIGLQGDVITGFVTYLGVNSPITGAAAWSGTGPMTLSYNVTRSTDLGTFYTMSISINGGALVAVQNAQISVSPGPVAGSRCTTNLLSGVVITAGQPSSYLIQSRDWFGNARLTPLDQFSFTFSVNPNDILSPSVTYLGLGVYQATFTATTAILHTISTFYNGVLIGGSTNPASLTFVPGPAARQSAVVTGSQLPLSASCSANTVFCITASSGSTTGGFDFDALDQYSNPRPAGADLSNFAPQCRNAQGLVCTQLPALTLVSNNRYQMRWGSRTVGNYSVGVTVSATGEQITGTPMFVVVTPDVSVPTQTTASGPGIAGGVEGTQTSFVVQARDQFGNLQLGTVTNQFQFRVNGGAATACVKNGATSTYTCTYTLPFPAPDISYTLLVEMFYLGSFQTALNYLPFSAASTSVFYAKPEPLPLAAIRTGVTATFIVRDQQSNGVSINTGCNCISVTVERNATGDISDYTFSGPTYITSTMGVAGDNSKYTIALNIVPTSPLATAVAGRYLVRVFKNAVQTVTSPYFLTILPGAFDLAQSTVPSSVTGVAGVRTSFTVIMRDAWGQLITQNATYLPVLTIAATPQVVVNGVWDAVQSWYTFSYNLTTAATVTGSLVMVSGGPTVTTISIVTGPAPVSARDCTAEGLYPDAINNNGLTKATVSIPQTFYVRAFDSFGNAVPGSGLSFVVASVDSIANPVYTPPTTSSPATNLYTGTWVPVTAAASATMGITLGGIHIRGSPFPLVVQPGAVSGSLSFITSIPATVPAGSTATWVLVTKDVNNNAWQSGNTAAITATVVTPPGATILAVVTARNLTTNPGEYDLSLPSTLIDPQSPFNFPYTAYVGTFQVQAVQVSVGASTTTIGTGVGSFSVVPGTPAAEKTSFVTAPFVNLPIETNHVVTFQLADTYGNTLTSGGGAVVRPAVQSGFAPTCAFSASGEASGSPQRDGALNPGGVFTYPATATDNGDGTYSFTLSSVGQGFFYVNATVNGRPIDCLTASKQAVQVSAGVASGNMSYAVGPALVAGATSAAGDLLLFDVFVQDRLGNLRKADGRDTIAVGVTCPGAPAPDCLPASFPVASYGINADRSRWLSAASAAKATVVVTYDNPEHVQRWRRAGRLGRRVPRQCVHQPVGHVPAGDHRQRPAGVRHRPVRHAQLQNGDGGGRPARLMGPHLQCVRHRRVPGLVPAHHRRPVRQCAGHTDRLLVLGRVQESGLDRLPVLRHARAQLRHQQSRHQLHCGVARLLPGERGAAELGTGLCRPVGPTGVLLERVECHVRCVQLVVPAALPHRPHVCGRLHAVYRHPTALGAHRLQHAVLGRVVRQRAAHRRRLPVPAGPHQMPVRPLRQHHRQPVSGAGRLPDRRAVQVSGERRVLRPMPCDGGRLPGAARLPAGPHHVLGHRHVRHFADRLPGAGQLSGRLWYLPRQHVRARHRRLPHAQVVPGHSAGGVSRRLVPELVPAVS
jgi:hypothetical protein